MSSVIVNWVLCFLKQIKIKISESRVISAIFALDSFLRKLIRNSFFFNLFSSDDSYDLSYTDKIADKILSVKNKISKRFLFIKEGIKNSTCNLFINNVLDNFYDINTACFGCFFTIIGAFAIVKHSLFNPSLSEFSFSVLLFAVGIVFLLAKTSLRKMVSSSVVLSFFHKSECSNFEIIDSLRYVFSVLGLVFGIIAFLFGIIPAVIPLLALFFVWWAFRNWYVSVVFVMVVLPFLPTMAMVALSLLLVGIMILKSIFDYEGNFETKNSVMNLAIPVYIVSLLFGTVFSYKPVASLKIALVYLAFVLFYYSIVKSVKTKKQFIYAVYGVVFASIPVSAYGIIQKLTGFDAQNTWLDSNMFEDISGRVVSFFENPNVFGEYLIWLVIISLSAFVTTKNKKLKITFAVAFAAAVLSMVFTYSRGCWIGVIFAIAIYLFITNKKVFWGFVFCGIVSLFFLPDSIITRISSVGNMADSSTSYRVYIWKGTFEMLKTYWLTGVGLGSDAFNEIYPLYAYSAINAPHPHNLYLLIMSETGIMGAIGFIFVIFVYYKNMIKTFVYTKSKVLKNFSAAFIAAMTGYLIQGLFDNVWYNYRIYMLFWIFVALATSLHLKGKECFTDDEDN